MQMWGQSIRIKKKKKIIIRESCSQIYENNTKKWFVGDTKKTRLKQLYIYIHLKICNLQIILCFAY